MKLALWLVLLSVIATGCFGGSSDSSTSSRSPVPVLTGAPDQIQPAASGSTLSWSQWSYRHGYTEYVRVGSGPITRINAGRRGSDSVGSDGGISGTTLVYGTVVGVTLPPWYQIRFYDIATHTSSLPPAGWRSNGDDAWRPSISGRFVLFGRTERGGTPLSYGVYLGDRTTGKLTQLASVATLTRSATLTPGQVNGNYAVWGQCRYTAHSDPRDCNVYRYDIAAKTTTRIPNTFPSGAFQYAPSVTKAGTIFFVHSDNGCGVSATLVRQPLGGSDTVLVTFREGTDVGSTYVDDASGTPTVYYSQSSCANGGRHGDVYKITD